MSYQRIATIPVAPNEARDWSFAIESAAAYATDTWMDNGVIGLDWAIFNRGAAPLTITLNGTFTITVPAGASRNMDNIKFTLFSVAAADVYTLILAGVRR